MTFKQEWEKTDQRVQIPPPFIQAMVREALPQKTLLSHEIISGGCANLNLKLTLKEEPKPFILRIYVRDTEGAYREQKLAHLLKKCVPLPDVYFIGECEGYWYAITEYISGINLRDFLLNHPHENMQQVMREAGQILSTIQSYEFPIAGFFDAQLNIIQPTSRQSYITFAKECLAQPGVLKAFGPKALSHLTKVFEKHQSLFPDEHQTHLVHGDYGPENLLVDKVEGQWKITGVLDWEFAFSGSPLQDVANMLRYAHHMPSLFEESFLRGLKETSLVLPENWRVTIDLLNLLALLDLLMRCSPQEQPRQYKDICELIDHILLNLKEHT